MTRKILGGAPIPIRIVESHKEGGVAMPVYLVTDRGAEGGNATPVYIVDNPDEIQAGAAMPVYIVNSNRKSQGGKAIPVYAINMVDSFTSDFETVPFSGWTGIDGTISQETFNRPGSTGTKCLRLTNTGAINYPCAWHLDTFARPGRWYQLDAWICRRTQPGACGTDVRQSSSDATMLATWGGAWTVDTWKRVITTFHNPSESSSVAPHFSFPATAANQYSDMDDVIFTPLTLANLISNVVTATETVNAAVRVINPFDTTALGIHGQAGVACNLDSATNPLNGVFAYIDWQDDGTNNRLVMEKCVNGVWTKLVTGNINYVLDGNVQLVRVGNDYSAYYNGTLVGTAQTITDASIITNTLHGVFRTHSGITVAGFEVLDGSVVLKFDKHVIAEADDGRWHEQNTTLTTTGQAIIGYNDATTKQTNAYARFTSVGVPAGATITGATLNMLSTYAGSLDNCNAYINAVLGVAPAAPTTYNEAESPAAGRTTAHMHWSAMADWADATWYATPDISAIIQELIDQGGWAGGAMLIYLEDEASTNTNYTIRKFQGGGAGVASAARLHIEFTE